MELRHLRYFVAVAEELHFGRAARRLNVVQPALSQQVQQLETELGVMLLARTKRRVALTESGRAFLIEAKRTLADAEAAVRAARRAGGGEVGRLRVGYVDLATWGVMPAILRAYRERFPEVELVLSEMHREPQREALARGDLDVGFFSLRDSDGPFAGVRVIADPLLVVVPSEHRLARRSSVQLQHLANEPWVLFPRELKTLYMELVLSACVSAGFVPRVVQEAGQLRTLAALVAAGLGVTMLPDAITETLPSGAVARRLRGAAPRLPLDVVWRHGDLSAAAEQFVNVAREVSAKRD
jgi:DNA-binding transcriptional LysR family regulator